jgi:hypothetical protein
VAAWKNLTPTQLVRLRKRLADALAERGVEPLDILLERSGLPGHYRLFVTAAGFSRLDYSERLTVLERALKEAWPREDQLRLTLQVAQSPDEVPTVASKRRTRKRTA